jgi:hypothetical protein
MTLATPLKPPESVIDRSTLTAVPDKRTRLDLARALLTDCLTEPQNRSAYPAIAAQLGVNWLSRQGLATLVWHLWRGQPAAGVSAEFAQRDRSAYYAAVGRDDLRRHELKATLAAFQQQGVTVVAFKGAALAHTVYPDSACRDMGDLDFWVLPHQMSQAQIVLENLGYQPRFNPTRPPALNQQNGGEIQYYAHTPAQSLVELHWGVFPGEWVQHTANVVESAIWARTQLVNLAGQPARILDPADSLIQICVHYTIGHNFSVPWLRTLVDVVLLARHQPLDWSVIVARARDWRVATTVWLMLSLAVDLCDLDEAAETARQLAPSWWRRKLIGFFAKPDALVNMRDLGQSRWRYVYLLLMVDRKRDMLKLVLRALWPDRDWLIARYGHYTFSTRVRHFLGAARGRI